MNPFLRPDDRPPDADRTRSTLGGNAPPRPTADDTTRASTDADLTRSSAGGAHSGAGFGFDMQMDDWMRRVGRVAQDKQLGRVGDYELLEEIGRGGQGIVYRARQMSTGRTVAIKRLLHGAFASATTRRRFAREVKASASLNHPNIVAIFGVETADEMPMIAMEWVEGVPLNKWFAAARPSGVRPIIELFLKVCDGVQHAHQRGIIHRDLKPSNIFVVGGVEGPRGQGAKGNAGGAPSDTGPCGPSGPIPKILDFGLAKFMTEDPGQTRMTMSSEFVGTPAYASPEQVRGDVDSLDTRTDVYALGLILFELLTGVLPFVNKRHLADMLQAILEEDPPRPSALQPRFDRELEIILLKAIAKRPEDRYATVDAFAGDLRRRLAGEPILAYPPSRVYQLKKALWRNRYAVSFVMTVFVGAVAFAVYAAIQNVRLTEQRNQAEKAKLAAQAAQRQSQRIAGFWQSKVASISPDENPDPTVRQFLDSASADLDQQLGADPEFAAPIHETLGSAYRNLKDEKAEHHLRRAVEQRAALGQSGDPRSLVNLAELANVLLNQGRPREAVDFLRQRWEGEVRAHSRMHPAALAALRTLADVLRDLGQHAALIEILAPTAEELTRDVAPARASETLDLLDRLAAAHAGAGDADAAERVAQSAADFAMRRFGEQSAEAAASLHVIGRLRLASGSAESLSALRAAYAAACGALPESDMGRAIIRRDLGRALLASGQISDAEREITGAFEVLLRAQGEAHPETQEAIAALISVYRALGDAAREAEFEELLSRDGASDRP